MENIWKIFAGIQTLTKGGHKVNNKVLFKKDLSSELNTANKLGFYAAILTTVFTVGTFVIAFFTPPLSGPFCSEGGFRYPFLDIASRFPRDYYWMYLALILTVIYIILMASIHQYASQDKKLFSLIGLVFASISAGVLFVDYFVQLSVIQPSLVNGEFDGISILTQYNPHGIFIALEDLGYLLMSISFLFMAPVFSGKNRAERVLRWLFRINFILAVSSLVLISYYFGIQREYRFEVAIITLNWLSLIIGGILLSVIFKRALSK